MRFDPWNPASKPPAPNKWVEVKLPDGKLAVAKWTNDGWMPSYPAGTPLAWRPRNGLRFRTLPYSTHSSWASTGFVALRGNRRR